jgi:hypothetical protein
MTKRLTLILLFAACAVAAALNGWTAFGIGTIGRQIGLFSAARYASVTAPFTLSGDYISQATETLDPVNGGRAAFTIRIPTTGRYYLRAGVLCPDDTANSFFVEVDEEPTTDDLWFVPASISNQTKEVTLISELAWPRVHVLSAGLHSAVVRGREAAARLYSVQAVAEAAPSIISTLTDSVANGSFYTYQIGAENWPTAYTATGTPGLPTGLTVNGTTGVISGTLSSGTGSFNITLGASNGMGSDFETLVLTVTGNSVPGAPTIGTAAATGATTANVPYTAPGSNGGATITGYVATSTPGGFTGALATAASGTIGVTGLSPSTAYRFSVTATNVVGQSAASALSNEITTSAAGTGGTVHVAASASKADIEAKLALAVAGDTVQVPAGGSSSTPVEWSSAITITKGIHLQGAGRDSTFIVCGGKSIIIHPDATTIANDHTIRVTGFDFSGNNTALNILQLIGSKINASKPYRGVAVGNNRFRNTSNQTGNSGVIHTQGQTDGENAAQVRGVIYNNIFDRCNVILKIMGNNDSAQEWVNSAYVPFAYGSSDNLFFEDNTITWSTPNVGNATNGWIETGQGGRICVRYNSWDYTNADTGNGTSESWDVHGFQNWAPNGTGNGQTGTMISEYYGNTLTNCPAARWIVHRGSWLVMHNNSQSGSGGGGILMLQYDTNQFAPDARGGSRNTGIPLLPGSPGGGYTSHINNTYIFNNLHNGADKAAQWAQGYSFGDLSQLTFENQHWWNYNDSFNGSSGIGRGTTVPTMSATDGVAYWYHPTTATPTTDPATIQGGTLYKRVNGVWQAYYTPYTYPHPRR